MWPTGVGGFEYFYGFIAGEDNQWYPSLYEGTTPIEAAEDAREGYHLTEDLADHAITWMRTQKSIAPDKPFFMYFAPGATHAPHHVPRSGSTSTRASSRTAGTSSARSPSPSKRNWASSPPTPS